MPKSKVTGLDYGKCLADFEKVKSSLEGQRMKDTTLKSEHHACIVDECHETCRKLAEAFASQLKLCQTVCECCEEEEAEGDGG